GEEEGILITGDFNLNKIAALQGVRVINLNDLANALKPVTLPGESLCVQVIREGRESGQGLAYLEDGTMIVVENGKKYIGAEVEVEVTSVLQTSAGRMIFARLKGSF
ncbi:MAG: TRAM domain-containing protein, partial [Christensenellaceae bacterium]|nr:TRAM domain-containing protein [Christensenellaceae bacterium]